MQSSFLFGHAAQAAAFLGAAASPASLGTNALPHLSVQPKAETCTVHGWFETIELPTPHVASALGLDPHAPLHLLITYSMTAALACASAAAVFDDAEFSWEQPDAPRPTMLPQDSGLIVQRFGHDIFLPALVKQLAAKWRAETSEASPREAQQPAKRSRSTSCTGGANAFVWLMQELWNAVAAADSNCAVCRAPLPAQAMRLAPCSRDVCLFSFEEMGGCPLLHLLREAGGASAALHCALTHAAAASFGGRDTFEPFPSFLLERQQQRQRAGFFDAHAAGNASSVELSQLAENKNIGRAVVVAVLCSLPPLAELAAMPDEAALRRRLLHLDWQDYATSASSTVPRAYAMAAAAKWPDAAVPDMAFRVLQFVLSTPRLQLHLLTGEHRLAGLSEDALQLAILGNSDAREATFQACREAAGGSFYAFHGSGTANWYSIMRNGLRSLSPTALMAHGAAHGSGVYLAANLSTSIGYTANRNHGYQGDSVDSTWQRAAADFAAACEMDVAKKPPVLVALCEVTNSCPQSNRLAASQIYVAGTEDVALRYLFLLPQGAQKSADATALQWNNGANALGGHIAALRSAALEAAEVARVPLREQRRLALQAKANTAGAEAADAVVNAAMARLEQVVAVQATNAAASATAARAVLREYRALDRIAASLGLGLSLSGEDDVFRWRILMEGWEHLSPELHDDLRAFATATGHPPAIELEFAFSPENFPFAAPFVRVVRPMFAFRTGHVTIGGSICMELLTSMGWSCAVSLESVLVTIRADMVEGGARLDRARFSSCYSEATAREAFKRVAQQHGWER